MADTSIADTSIADTSIADRVVHPPKVGTAIEEFSLAMEVVNDGGVLLVRFKVAALDVVIRRGSGRRG